MPHVDSPTVSRIATRIFFALSALLGWTVVGFDVPTAFLQQDGHYASQREPVHVQPPPEAGLKDDECWELLKISYGLADAPRAWYFSFDKFIRELGGKPVVGEPCVFTFHEDDKLVGHMTIHVDDGCMAGEQKWLQYMKEALIKRYAVKEFKEKSFKVCGLWVEQDDDTIRVHQEPYCDMLDEIPLTRERKQQLEQRMTAKELNDVQSVGGAVNWIATQTGPDRSWSVSELAGIANAEGTVEAIKKAKKLVRRTKSGKENSIVFKKFTNDISDLALVTFTDASWANMPGLRSQRGSVYALMKKSEFVCAKHDDHSGDVPGCIFHWESKRIKRVVRSTFAGETLAAIDAFDMSIFTKKILEE